MRGIREGKADEAVISLIGSLYEELKDACCYRKVGNYCSRSYEDIFQDTVLFVSQDKKAARITGKREFIKYFKYRFKMIEYQFVHDNKMMKEEQYADYKKNEKMEQEE